MATINADVLKARGISIPEGSVLERTTREGIKFDVSRLTDEQLNTLANTQALNGGTPQETQQEVPEVIETPAIDAEQSALQKILSSFGVREGAAERRGELIEESGLADIQAQRNQINQQLLQEQRALEKAQRSLLEENPDALIGAGAQTDFGRIERRSLQKQADLAIIKAGLQGNEETANNLINQRLELEFGAEIARLDAVKEQLPFLTDLADSERAQISAEIEAQKDAIESAEAEKAEILELSRQAAKNGFSTIAQQIAAAGSFDEANALFISTGAARKASTGGGGEDTAPVVGILDANRYNDQLPDGTPSQFIVRPGDSIETANNKLNFVIEDGVGKVQAAAAAGATEDEIIQAFSDAGLLTPTSESYIRSLGISPVIIEPGQEASKSTGLLQEEIIPGFKELSRRAKKNDGFVGGFAGAIFDSLFRR